MAIEEVMHRLIPFPVELFKGIGVPPILIELPAIQPSDFSKEITHILKDQVEVKDDKSGAWQHQSKNELDKGYLLAHLNPWLNELSMQHVDDYEKSP
jgi:hypothetical protein